MGEGEESGESDAWEYYLTAGEMGNRCFRKADPLKTRSFNPNGSMMHFSPSDAGHRPREAHATHHRPCKPNPRCQGVLCICTQCGPPAVRQRRGITRRTARRYRPLGPMPQSEDSCADSSRGMNRRQDPPMPETGSRSSSGSPRVHEPRTSSTRSRCTGTARVEEAIWTG